jgi:hypothetical protein
MTEQHPKKLLDQVRGAGPGNAAARQPRRATPGASPVRETAARGRPGQGLRRSPPARGPGPQMPPRQRGVGLAVHLSFAAAVGGPQRSEGSEARKAPTMATGPTGASGWGATRLAHWSS